jgi:hypothetical protein
MLTESDTPVAASRAQKPGPLSSLVHKQCSRRGQRLSSVAARHSAALLAPLTAAQRRKRQRGQECRNGRHAALSPDVVRCCGSHFLGRA